jgi:hypothetical protein
MGIQIMQDFLYFFLNAGRFQKVSIGKGRNGIAVGNVDAFGNQFPPHFTEGCVFPADLGDVGQF